MSWSDYPSNGQLWYLWKLVLQEAHFSLICRLDPKDVPAMCRKNASVAASVGREDLVQVRGHHEPYPL